MSVLRYCFCFCAMVCALPVLSLPPTDQHLLEPVRSIESADQITQWEQLDDQHVVLKLNQDDQYLITLEGRCLGLNWGRHIAVTMSNNTIWAGFDAITVDGNQCKIETINPVKSP